MAEVSLQDYYDMLDRHDWFFEYSDDGRVWRAGRESLTKLRSILKQSPEHEALYKAYAEHVFSGSSYETEKKPKPERPN